MPATASSIAASVDGGDAATFRCIRGSGNSLTFRPAIISEVLERDRFRLKSKLFVRELREAVPLANLALPVQDSKALLCTGARALYQTPANAATASAIASRSRKFVAVTISRADETTCDLTEDELYEHCRVTSLRSSESLFVRAPAPPRPGSQVLHKSRTDGYSLAHIAELLDNEACSLFKLGEAMEAVSSARLASPGWLHARGAPKGDSRVRILPRGRVHTVLSTTDDGAAMVERWPDPVQTTCLQRTRTASILVQDFAGQDEYYITHSLFLTNGVLIVICFELSKVFDEASFEAEILFFLRNIRARVPRVRVLLIGTKRDLLVPGGAAAVKAKTDLVKALMRKEAYMEKLRQSRTSAKSEELPAMPDAVFAVSSGPGLPGFEELREAIKQSISDRSAFPDVGAQFPRSYMVLRDEVRMARAAGERPIMEWNEYREKLARPAGIADDGALSTATDLMHTLGELLHYADTEELASTVFPNPSFLIDMMKYVIRHDHEEALRPDPAFVDDMTPATFTEAKQNFLRRGILSHRLLRRMWAPLDLSDLQFERLVQLLEQFEIALGLPDDGVEPRLLVPSFLRDPLPVGAGGAWPAECPADTYEVTRLVDLGNFVPDCFMQRLQVPLCSLLSGRDRSRFACDGAMIVSGKSRLLVRISMTTLEIAVRAKDATTAWRKLLVDALPRVVSVLKKWPAVAFDVWAPWRLASGETRLFLVSSLHSERQNGRDHAGVAALSEAWTDALTSAREMTDASSAALWTVSSHEVRARATPAHSEDGHVPLSALLGPPELGSDEAELLSVKEANANAHESAGARESAEQAIEQLRAEIAKADAEIAKLVSPASP